MRKIIYVGWKILFPLLFEDLPVYFPSKNLLESLNWKIENHFFRHSNANYLLVSIFYDSHCICYVILPLTSEEWEKGVAVWNSWKKEITICSPWDEIYHPCFSIQYSNARLPIWNSDVFPYDILAYYGYISGAKYWFRVCCMNMQFITYHAKLA